MAFANGTSSRSSQNPEAEAGALLKVSPRVPIPNRKGLFHIRIWRRSNKQPFGIQFASSNGLIEIAEELPHLSLQESDAVISVNGKKVTSVQECLGAIGDANVVDLVVDPVKFDPKIWNGEQASTSSAEVELETVLSASQSQGLGADRKEFEIAIERKSIKQRLGLNFSAQKQVGGLSITIAESQPHLGLVAGDQLISVNGVNVHSMEECQRILERSMTIFLRLKRRQAQERDATGEESPKTGLGRATRYPELKKHFATLNLAETGDHALIRQQYKNLAKVWHPDKNSDKLEEAKARFQAINNAYEAIRNRLFKESTMQTMF